MSYKPCAKKNLVTFISVHNNVLKWFDLIKAIWNIYNQLTGTIHCTETIYSKSNLRKHKGNVDLKYYKIQDNFLQNWKYFRLVAYSN